MSNPAKVLSCLLLVTALVGCPEGGETTPPPPPAADGAADGAAAAGPAIPDALYLAARPDGANESLLDVKTKSKVGDSVVFEARVGGRVEPFVDGRAIFLVTDSVLQSCEQMGEADGCKTPWDYCCETKENLLKHVATVRFVDAAGEPIKVSAKDHKGLTGSKTVVVRGKVKEADGTNFVVDAEGVWIGS